MAARWMTMLLGSAVMLVSVACKSGDVNPSTPVAGASGLNQYHDPYLGIDFQYPSSWKDKREEHVPIAFDGANGCTFHLIAMEPLDRTPAAENLADLRQQDQQENPGATFGDRPAWAGAQKPDGGYQKTSVDHGRRVVEWDTTFQQGLTVDSLIETMRATDADCAAKLQAIEKTFRLYKQLPLPVVGK